MVSFRNLLNVYLEVIFFCLLSLTLFYTLFNNPPHSFSTLFEYDKASTNINDKVFENGSLIFGKSYADWTEDWWKWAISIPIEKNPAYDDLGTNCIINQKPPIWFFPGTFNHSVTRICLIPNNVAILFPILNSECSFIEFPKLHTGKELSDCARKIQDHVISLNATLDYQNIPNLEKTRIHSDLFDFKFPQNNILGIKYNGTSKAVSDGNWVFLKPLPLGIHHLTFHGGILNKKPEIIETNGKNDSFAFPSGWDYQTTYELIVIPYSLDNKLSKNTQPLNNTVENFKNPSIQNLLQIIFDNHTNHYQPINQSSLNELPRHFNGWHIIKNNTTEEQHLQKEFRFKSFPQSIGFAYYVSLISQILNHHPNIDIEWQNVTIRLNTWALNNTISNMDTKEMILFDQLYNEVYNKRTFP